MHKLHIANTFFEWELESTAPLSLAEAFAQHVVFKQLQFLPVLYAKPQESFLALDTPPSNYLSSLVFETPKMISDLSQPLSFTTLESWAPSLIIAKWAKKQNIPYCMPDWELVKQIHSKEFAFNNGLPLDGSTLLYNQQQTRQWLHQLKSKKVVKTCFGTSGKGHLLIEDTSEDRLFAFLQKQWDKALPVIAEPWVERVLDFSTQWMITLEREIIYLGATLCNNTKRGQYESSDTGEESLLFGNLLPYFDQHKEFALPVLNKIKDKGWFGNLGIDAFIYKDKETLKLHPLVEINARKTMGYVALMTQKNHFPHQLIRLSYAEQPAGLLPTSLSSVQGKHRTFSRNLTISREV